MAEEQKRKFILTKAELRTRGGPCIDLDRRFGDRYWIGWEDGGRSRPLCDRAETPWLRVIRCRYGEVYAYGRELLAAYTPSARIGVRLRRLPFLEHAQGDVEVVVRFHLDHLPAVLAILQPRRRRRMTSKERLQLNEVGARTRFRRQDSNGVEKQFTAAESPQSDRRDRTRGPGRKRKPAV